MEGWIPRIAESLAGSIIEHQIPPEAQIASQTRHPSGISELEQVDDEFTRLNPQGEFTFAELTGEHGDAASRFDVGVAVGAGVHFPMKRGALAISLRLQSNATAAVDGTYDVNLPCRC